MKAKLLKKIRKRFDWYISDKGSPVLIDHLHKSITVINIEELKRYYNYKDDSWKNDVEVPVNEWSWRNLKQRMLQPFGYSIERIWYNSAMRRRKIKRG